MLSTATSTELLAGLRDDDNRTVWDQFVSRYRPQVVATARRVGLPPEDAEDVAQEVLIEFLRAYRGGKYERDKGRLRAWLLGMARICLANWRRRHQGRARIAETQQLEALLADDGRLEAMWEAEWRDAVLRQCMAAVRAEVQPSTWRAFELFACQEWPARRVAAELGMTETAVFGAKRRVLQRVQELRPHIEEDW